MFTHTAPSGLCIAAEIAITERKPPTQSRALITSYQRLGVGCGSGIVILAVTAGSGSGGSQNAPTASAMKRFMGLCRRAFNSITSAASVAASIRRIWKQSPRAKTPVAVTVGAKTDRQADLFVERPKWAGMEQEELLW